MLFLLSYLSFAIFSGEEERPVRPGMLITITSGLCLFLTGVSLMIGSSKGDNFNASKHAAGVVMLVLALLFFLLVVLMCVRHAKKARAKKHSLTSLILSQAYADDELLQISVEHVEKKMCRNCENKLFSLPNILNEEVGNPEKVKGNFAEDFKRISVIKTIA